MKPKYQKPTLTSFPVINAGAQDGGFEPLGICGGGAGVGPYVAPGCSAGAIAGASPADCKAGSGDAGTLDTETYCFPGGLPTSGFCAAGSTPP